MPKTTKSKKANKPEAKKGSAKRSPVKKLDYRTVLMGRVCFFCGNTKDVVRIKKNVTDESEDAKYGVFDYAPCDECKKKWDTEHNTVILGCVTTKPEGNWPPIASKTDGELSLYPTGSVVCINKAAAKRVFGLDNKDIVYADEAIVKELAKKYEELKKKQGEDNA